MKKILEANSQKRFIETLLVLISMFSAGLIGYCLTVLLIKPLGHLLNVDGWGWPGFIYVMSSWSIVFAVIFAIIFASVMWGYLLGKGKIKTAVIIISVVLFAGLLMFSQIFIK